MKGISEYAAIDHKINRTAHLMQIYNYKALADEGYAIQSQCDKIDFMTEATNLLDYYYIMDEKLFSYYTFLDGSYLNPFMHKFQEIMLYLFEGGFHHIWEVLFKIKHPLLSKFKIKNAQKEVNYRVVTVEDIRATFNVIWGLQCLTIFVFVLEIFYHDFIKYFKIHMLLRSQKSKKSKVKKILVKPVEQLKGMPK